MKKGWVEVTLGDICESASNIKWSEYKGDGLEYIDLTSVDRNSLMITETTKVTSDNAPSRARKVIHEDDVIFATTRPTLKRVTIIGREYHNQICSTGFAVLRPIADVVITRFIYYFILSEAFMRLMESLQRGASYPAVSEKDVRQSSLKVPESLEEQKKIVATLDDAFAAIEQAQANIQKNIDNAKELFESKRDDFFIEAYELSENRSDILKNLCVIKTGKLNANAMVENGKYPFFTCSREVYSIDNYAFDTEAVLLAGNNASGDFNVKYYKGKFNAYQRTYVITINNQELSYSFLKHKLEHNLQVFKKQSVGANTRFLKIGMISNLEVPLPTIEIQKNLCENLDLLNESLEKVINLYITKIKSLEDLKKSLLEKAFAGELTSNQQNVIEI